MTDELLLAIDVGTGSIRAVLFTPDGSQRGIGQCEYTHPADDGIPGSHVFRTEENWELICRCIRQAFREAGASADAVVAISATSMREGMVLYDSGGREIWACPNVDARAAADASTLVETGAAEEIYDIAGDWVAITAPARFRWLARSEPELFGSIAHMGMLGDWVVTRLTGEFVTDPSLGSSSGMFDLTTREWSPRVLELSGVDLDVMPTVVDSGIVVGAVTTRAAAETGLRPGTPVVVGGADTQLALIGLGATVPGSFTVVGGSFWQQTVVLAEPLTDPERRLRTLCHTVPGRWMMEGIGFYNGIVMRWFRDAFCEAEKAEAAAAGIDVYELLEQRAAALPPGSNGVLGLVSNLMNARRWVHASPTFLGFDVNASPGTARVECFRAIEEAAAYVSRGHLDVVREVSGLDIQEVVFTGGAAKGALWSQLLADTLGLRVRVPVVKESTALGAALYAAQGVGLIGDAAAIAEANARYDRTCEPEPTAAATYEVLYDNWVEVYRRSVGLVDEGLVRPLWRAAGT